MRRFLLLLPVLALAVCTLYAQPDPDRPQPDQPVAGRQPLPPGMFPMPATPNDTSAVIEVTPVGVFLLSRGVLARFDAQLAQPTVSLSLFGPMPEQPQPMMDRTVFLNWQQETNKRTLPGAMVVDGDALLIVSGDTFFRVNQRTLVIEAKQTLAPRNDLDMRMNHTTPMLKLHETTLYLLRGNEMIALQAKTGENIGRVLLPKDMQFQTMQQPQPGQPPQPRQDPPPNNPGGANPPPGPFGGGERMNQAFDPKNPFMNNTRQTDPVAAQTIVGTLVQYKNLNNGIWTLKGDDGAEYVLEGDMLRKLLQTDNIGQQRVRVTGAVSQRRDQPDFSRGYLRIDTFEVLAP